VANK
jgi:hypothetical protein